MTLHDPPAIDEASRHPSPRSFAFALSTTAAEGFGDVLARTLLPIMAVTVLGLGTGFVGLLNSIGLAAFLLLGAPIGMRIDRLRSRQQAMGFATTARCLALLVLAVSYYAHWLSGGVVVGVAVVIGLADVVFTTAEGALIPAIVHRERLKHAYSRLAIVSQSASITAAGAGSATLGLIGMTGMMWATIAAYAGSVLFQRGIKTARRRPKADLPRARAKLRDGFQALRRVPALWALTISSALTNAGVMLGNTVLPVFLLRDLGVTPAAFAGLGVLSALGAILGAMAAPRLSARLGLRALRGWAPVLSVPAVGMAIACQQLPGPELIWLAGQTLTWGFLVSIAAVAGAEVLPRSIPPEQLATVGSAQRTITLGIMPIAALLGGAAATLTGPVPLLFGWALLAGAAAIPVLTTQSLKAFR